MTAIECTLESGSVGSAAVTVLYTARAENDNVIRSWYVRLTLIDSEI